MSTQWLTREAYHQIRGGMSLAEVEAILGKPGERERPAFLPTPSHERGDEWFWSDGNEAIYASFDPETGTLQGWGWARPLPPDGDYLVRAEW